MIFFGLVSSFKLPHNVLVVGEGSLLGYVLAAFAYYVLCAVFILHPANLKKNVVK